MFINEAYNVKNGVFNKKDGSKARIAYIDPASSDNTYQYKDVFKKYGANWFNTLKAWGWFLNENPEQVYRNKIQPCLLYVEKLAKASHNVIEMIDRLLAELQSGNAAPNEVNAETKENIMDKLSNFKEELLKIVSDEEFKKMLEPIIKFKKAQGHALSFSNAILVWIQDPEAKMVKSRGNWANVNRRIKPNAKAIWLWIPKGMRKYTREEKDQITADFLRKCNVRSVKDLSPGEKEELSIQLKGTNPSSFDLGPYFYDYRFTEQIEGKEDLVGNPDHDIPWFDESGEETEHTVQLVDALIEVIEKSGVKLGYVENLGGARGVSKSGKIDVLKNQQKNTGLLNTLTHEFAHEMLHQRYLKEKNSDFGEYFVGTSEGRSKVEQQAELCAWIVLKNFGYNMPTNINYVGLWGLNQDNAASVFDSVTKVASYIVNAIEKNLTNMNESRMIKESFLPNGYELAKMLGFGDIYLKSKEKEQQRFESRRKRSVNITESDINRMVLKTVKRLLRK